MLKPAVLIRIKSGTRQSQFSSEHKLVGNLINNPFGSKNMKPDHFGKIIGIIFSMLFAILACNIPQISSSNDLGSVVAVGGIVEEGDGSGVLVGIAASSTVV